ncbi:MAG: GNAT family N-acetyltransferase [Bacteroidales bacterium]|nr:GNAT family N-acetyltransferase [Bacteroidales bacterium]
MVDTSYIIPKVPRDLLRIELKHKHFLRKTNCGNKEIYITTAHLSPNIMREIGRLRELSFALDGGGTGKDCDIDEFDTLPEPYCFKQLFVWSPEDEEIVGGYRFIHGSNMLYKNDGTIATPTSELFQYSEDFTTNYLPYTVELGRAFVQPEFQPGNNFRKGLYSLDNLWDGLGAIALEIPETRYFFGKITMYPQMNPKAKDLIRFFLKKHFPDRDGLVWPYEALPMGADLNELDALFSGRNYKEDYQILVRSVRSLGSVVPAMLNAYMNLSPTMRSFGTAMNVDFGNTDETGLLVALHDIAPEKKQRYFESYVTKNHVFDRLHLFRINMKRMPWWKKINDEERIELRRLKRMKLIADRRKGLATFKQDAPQVGRESRRPQGQQEQHEQ